MFLEKRYGGKIQIELKNKSLVCSKKIGQRDTLFFTCKKCNKEGHRRIALFKDINEILNRDLYCEQCNREQNSLDKHGVKNPMQRKNVVELLKKSNIKKYGVENPMMVESIAKRSGETRRKYSYNYRKLYENVEIITPFIEFNGTKKNYDYMCKICGFIFSYNTQDPNKVPRCIKCAPLNLSKPENEIIDFLELLEIKVIKSSRKIIPPYEIDIFIPDKNIAIEFNGLYWHSEIRMIKANKNPRKYHLNKQKMCQNKGIFLIHIFEDEWKYKKEIVKSRLKNILGVKANKRIFARKTEIKEMIPKEKNIFLRENHLQGEDSALIKLGLFNENELISVMTFSKPRHFMGGDNKLKYTYELSRFVNKKNYVIVGGASKLLKFFIKNYNPKKIYTYSDKRWSVGNLYKKIGFVYAGTSAPNYWYVKNGKRFYRFNFRKQQLPNLLENFNSNLTEYQNMLNNDYDRIWDCGNDKWELII